jgi:ribonucleotide reductase alpha subunit
MTTEKGRTLITDEFLENYRDQTPPWGFGGLGEIVYLRTYSRKVEGTDRNETWPETIQRVINGAIEIGTPYTQKEAEALFDHMFHLRASMSGRALWQLGTPLVKKFNAGSLNNCYFTNIESIDDFEFLFEHLMLGGGVGFSVERSKIHEFPKVKTGVKISHERSNDADFIVADSREGWKRLLHAVLKSYFHTGRSFTYSTILVREFGAPLNTFGGTASGPGALIEGIDDISKVMENRAGKKLRSVDVLDIANIIGRIVVSGSSRRSAQIAIGDPDDILFLRAKNWGSGNVPGWRANSNNSIYADSYDEIMNELWKGYDGTGEPYGLLNRKLARTMGRLGEKKPDPSIEGYNPCVVGETLIGVADGRGAVPIAQLAAEGLDVPVYSFDPVSKRPVVKMMRNPHKTGTQVPVLKVILDSGDEFTCTPDHKFVTKEGERVEAADLTPGTSLRVMTRYQSSFNPQDETKQLKQPYWYVTAGSQTNREHRMIAEYHADRPLGRDDVVHHINHVGLDNSPENLTIMKTWEHDALHAAEMTGSNNPMVRGMAGEFGSEWIEACRGKQSDLSAEENNPNFSGRSNEELKAAALELTTLLGRRVSAGEWAEWAKENNYPTAFSGWRQSVLGSMSGFLNWAATEAGFTPLHGNTARSLSKLWEQGYDAEIIDGEIVFNKHCEICRTPFTSKQRQSSICSQECVSAHLASPAIRDKAKATRQGTDEKKRTATRELQAKTWSDLRFNLGRQPLKAEWLKACKDAGISAEIARESSPFRTYADLVDAGENHNHKVVAVVDAGVADVYNGTVDEYHTYFMGGWESMTASGKPKQHFVLSVNCAEIALADGESCNLATIFLPNVKSFKQFTDISKLLYKAQKTITGMKYPYEKTTKIVSKNRRIGQSVTGILQATEEQLSWLSKGYEALRDYDIEYSAKHGIPESIRLTTVQPSGTLALLPGQTPGVHPAYARYYIRRVRFGAADPLVDACRARGYNVVPDMGLDGREDHTRWVVEFPAESPEGAVLAKDMTAVEQLEWVKRMQTEWADNAVSVTVYYRLEELPAIKEWLKENYTTGVKSVSFLLHADHNFPLAPYEEIDKEAYEKMLAKVDFSVPLGSTLEDDLLDDPSCATGACPVR